VLNESGGSHVFFRRERNRPSGSLYTPIPGSHSAQASVTLPSVGGYDRAQTGPFQLREMVSVRSAHAETAGSLEEESRITTAIAVVEGLNILDVVTADRVVARVSGEHSRGQTESRMSLTGSHFENLRIHGRPVEFDMEALLFDEFSTFSDLERLHSRKGSRSIPIMPLREGAYRTSLARYPQESGWKQNGLAIEVPDFGRIYLAELIVRSSYRRLNMLRLELGSPVAGRVVVASASCNGLAGDAGKDDD
jgi:hypothetical protein